MFDLADRIIAAGVENVRFFIPCSPLHSLHGFGLPLGMTSSDDPMIEQECRIDERLYKVKDDYKITLVPLNEGYASVNFYFMDLRSLMREQPEKFRMVVNSNSKE